VRRRVFAIVFAAVVTVAACSSGTSHAGRTTTTSLVPVATTTTLTTAASTTTAGTIPATTSTTTPCTSRAEIARWPLAQRAARLVVVPVFDFDVAAVAPALRAGAGGVLFLGNAAAPSDLRARLAAAGATGARGAPLVMADVEGGGVQRLAPVVAPFPWPRDLAATQTPAQVEQLATRVARSMRDAGVDVDLAPLLDLDDRPGPTSSNPDGRRSFSLDPAITTAYGAAFVRGLRAGGVLPVVKHFPGLGGSTTNTDFGPAPTLPLATLRTAGLKPFADAIEAGVPAVMVANASVPGLTTRPATLSSAAISGLLRGELGFDGLVVTDSLSAGAVRAAGYDVPHAAAAAIAAGADTVLFGSTLTPADVSGLQSAAVSRSFSAIVDAITAAAARGTITETRLDDAVAHVLAAQGVTVCS
jgi:beta-N-acetylhexosaminidase